ncbi:hypothetical protein GCM10022281_12080 [Sphingomonas rosea]|uniref:DUF1440 domain-containing protein n=1 Tax=Sphingomonas rosea TaxID=335605 RepID=A0ABP7U1V4_9SPHN
MSKDQTRPSTNPDLLRGAAAGLVAGLAASFAMDLAQRLLSKMQPPSDSEPATEKAADRLAEAATGAPVPKESRPMAGQAVHYAFGAVLGASYGALAERYPDITEGGGALFGLGTALIFDEVGVPAAGLGDAPWKAKPETHLYALASHLVFGTATEGTRRLVRAAL